MNAKSHKLFFRCLLPAVVTRLVILGCLLFTGVYTLHGCSKPGNSAQNYTNAFITIVAINNDTPLQSDVLTHGYARDDTVIVHFKSEPRIPDDDPTTPRTSPLNTITFHTYHVAHQRSDGGPNPSDFTAGMNVMIPPESEAEVDVVVVRAFDKHRSPLEELRDDGEIFTSSLITFYGEDGYGNDLSVTASMAISFANFPDSES